MTRDWNAPHGGVYVPVIDSTSPKAFLELPGRDVTTRDGMALTMVDPAFVTRQTGEIAAQTDGVSLHITSLNPIRPGNAPDAWEAEALRRFEAGPTEIVELIPGAAPVHRYMAPLRFTESCLACHAKQGYRREQVRGGMSVTMPAAHLLEVRDAERTRSLSNANEELARQVAERELAAAVFENAAEAIIVTDEAGLIVRVNPAFSRITGYASSEVLGRASSLLKSGRQPEEFFAEMWQGLKREGYWEGEVWTTSSRSTTSSVTRGS
ncbi:MAG: DUF3365 domain-containing protein [Rhodocyclaceae bacterium]|nr:DUF3365 domain-containing protein [Rhodocyclaceae bacterium]